MLHTRKKRVTAKGMLSNVLQTSTSNAIKWFGLLKVS